MKYGNSTLMFQQGRNEMLKTRSLKRGFPSLGNHTETPSFQHVSRWFPWRELRHSAKFPVWGNDYARWNFIEKYKTIYINNKKSNFWADFQVDIFFSQEGRDKKYLLDRVNEVLTQNADLLSWEGGAKTNIILRRWCQIQLKPYRCHVSIMSCKLWLPIIFE